eukprot:TRINITY_DN4555_c0_g1_i1.p1 TRINITY_DN4555_c0_g1~~TRINITY_DN4555_c0_g1_i1.p1  ORF type:complete len:132 (-),score=3.32 TRINITY_DN4555_c0_g1_i1:173-568(-)
MFICFSITLISILYGQAISGVQGKEGDAGEMSKRGHGTLTSDKDGSFRQQGLQGVAISEVVLLTGAMSGEGGLSLSVVECMYTAGYVSSRPTSAIGCSGLLFFSSLRFVFARNLHSIAHFFSSHLFFGMGF